MSNFSIRVFCHKYNPYLVFSLFLSLSLRESFGVWSEIFVLLSCILLSVLLYSEGSFLSNTSLNLICCNNSLIIFHKLYFPMNFYKDIVWPVVFHLLVDVGNSWSHSISFKFLVFVKAFVVFDFVLSLWGMCSCLQHEPIVRQKIFLCCSIW